MRLKPADAFSVLPITLRDDLLNAFNEIVKNYREHRWEPSELNGGKLCEAVFTIIEGYLEGGNYPRRAKKPSRFPQTCWALEQKYATVADSRSPRILMPRLMLSLYDIRNNRGGGHAGADVDPNRMDATFVLYASKWLMAELVRLLHTLTTEEATAIVEGLSRRSRGSRLGGWRGAAVIAHTSATWISIPVSSMKPWAVRRTIWPTCSPSRCMRIVRVRRCSSPAARAGSVRWGSGRSRRRPRRRLRRGGEWVGSDRLGYPVIEDKPGLQVAAVVLGHRDVVDLRAGDPA